MNQTKLRWIFHLISIHIYHGLAVHVCFVVWVYLSYIMGVFNSRWYYIVWCDENKSLLCTHKQRLHGIVHKITSVLHPCVCQGLTSLHPLPPFLSSYTAIIIIIHMHGPYAFIFELTIIAEKWNNLKCEQQPGTKFCVSMACMWDSAIQIISISIRS